MKVLFDTNIIIDVLQGRVGFYEASAQLVDLAAKGTIEGMLSATTHTTVFYLSKKLIGEVAARTHLTTLLDIFSVAPIDQKVIANAANAASASFKDFEDAVIYQAAIVANADVIVTRNKKDFYGASILVLEPIELLATLEVL